MKKALTFLYVGELGWEYLRWLGYCRKIAESHKSIRRLYVCTHEGRNILYNDFCDGSIAHDFWFILQQDNGRNFGKLHGYGTTGFTQADYDKLERWTRKVIAQKYGIDTEIMRTPIGIKRKYEYALQHMVTIDPPKESITHWNYLKDMHLEGCDPIVAVFPRKKEDTRDWGEENYKKLIGLLLNHGCGVVICGSYDMSFCTSIKTSASVINLTEMPVGYILGMTLAALRDCDVALGGQSCLPVISLGQAVPTIMWGCEPTRHRLYYNWGKMSCIFIESQIYDISPGEIFMAFTDFMKREDRASIEKLENKNWRMLIKGESLPDEKDKRRR